MVSMKDVAKACGVSVATVSKALNNYSDVGEEKRREIKETARRMGYLPNLSARALKTKRTYNLGILFVDEAQSGLTHDYFSSIIESFKVTAEAKGYDITFVNSNMSRSNLGRSYYERCRYRGLEGIVIACIDFYTPETQQLIRSDLPVVTIDYVFDGRTSVASDNVRGMRELMEYICGMGHRKIAYIHGFDSSTTRDRLTSFYRVLSDYGIEASEEYVRQAAYRDTEETQRQTGELLDLPDPPTCIICPDDFAALGCIRAVQARGLRIPEDVSVVGFDGITVSQVLEPRLTTVRQDTRTIGRRAAEELISLIENPRTTLAEKILVPGELVPGDSVRRMN